MILTYKNKYEDKFGEKKLDTETRKMYSFSFFLCIPYIPTSYFKKYIGKVHKLSKKIHKVLS